MTNLFLGAGSKRSISSTAHVVGSQDGTQGSLGICAHGLARTLDAGQTWTTACLPVTSQGTLGAIGFGSTTHGWLAADNTLWRSVDGGANWTQQRTFPARLNWIQAQDAASAWAQHGASLWRTLDGGANWQLLTETAPARVTFRTSMEGWGTDGSSIAKTTDGGNDLALGLHAACSPGPGMVLGSADRLAGGWLEPRTHDRRRRHLAQRGHRFAGGRRVPVRGRPGRLGLA